MTEREEFIFSKIKDARPRVLRMEDEKYDTRFFVLYNDEEINFVFAKDDYILPLVITLKDFLSIYSDDEILAAILKAVL